MTTNPPLAPLSQLVHDLALALETLALKCAEPESCIPGCSYLEPPGLLGDYEALIADAKAWLDRYGRA